MTKFKVFGYLGGSDCSYLQRIMVAVRHALNASALSFQDVACVSYCFYGNGSTSKYKDRTGFLQAALIRSSEIEIDFSIDCTSYADRGELELRRYVYDLLTESMRCVMHEYIVGAIADSIEAQLNLFRQAIEFLRDESVAIPYNRATLEVLIVSEALKRNPPIN